MMKEITDVKILSHLHDACILIDSFFDSTAQVLQSVYYLETIFFKLIYTLIDEPSTKYSLIQIPHNKLSQLSIECNGMPIKEYDYNLIQKGETLKLIYMDQTNNVQIDKKYNVLKQLNKDRQSLLNFYVKETAGSNSTFIDNKLEEQMINQYELTFILKELDNSILLYIKIELHPTKQIFSPFNREFKKKLQEELHRASRLPKYRCNYESEETVLIKSSKEQIFSIISNPKTYSYSDFRVETNFQLSHHLNVGDKFLAYMKLTQTNLEFEVTNFKYENDEDCIFSCRLISKVPNQTAFSFTFTVKSFRPNLQFLIFKNEFEEPMQPEFMKKHSKIKRATLIRFKNHAESLNQGK